MKRNAEIARQPRGPVRGSGGWAAGFTLIEVLVAMVILCIMVVIIGNLFQQMSLAWDVGVENAQVNNAGRAALDLIANDLSQAIAGQIEAAQYLPGGATSFTFRMQPKDVSFVCFSRNPDSGHRGVRGIRYYWNGTPGDPLMRGVANDVYDSASWSAPFPPGSELLPHVYAFRLYAYDEVLGDWTDTLDQERLPVCVDVLIELMGEDARKTYESGTAHADFFSQNARRYCTRVYLRNQGGYTTPMP